MRVRSIVLSALLFTSTAALAVPQTMVHQGRLFDALGSPLTGSDSIEFALFDAPAGGTEVWTETQTVDFDNGYFVARLGETTPMDTTLFDDDLWIEITVAAGAPLTRFPLDSVAFARRADVTTDLQGGVVDATEIRVNGTTVINSSGAVSAPVSWTDITDLPSGLGDASLGQLVCSGTEQIALWDGSAWVCAGANVHLHDAADIATGIVDIARLPVGSGATDVAAGDHGHDIVALGGVPYITSNVTYNIGSGGDYATLSDALTALQGSLIAPNATVTLDMADGAYTLTSPIEVNHPNGDRIAIVGNTSNPAAVTLNVNGSHGLYVRNGNKLRRFDGFTLQGNGTASTVGVLVDRDGYANVGPNLVVDGFGSHGLQAVRGSFLWAEGVTSTNNGGRGIYALYNSYIRAGGATVSNNGSHGVEIAYSSSFEGANLTLNSNNGHGLVTHGASSAYTDGSTGDGNRYATFQANWSSFTSANNTTSLNTTEGPGLGAAWNGSVTANDVVISKSAQAGINAGWGGAINAPRADIDDTTHAGVNANWGSLVSVSEGNIANSAHAGVNANWGSTINAYKAQVPGSGHSGINANWDSAIHAQESSVTNSAHAGYTANWGSTMYAQQSSTSGNGHSGYNSNWESVLHAYKVSSTNNTNHGMYTGPNSTTYAAESNISNNTLSGALGDWASYFDLNASTVNSNGDHGIGVGWNGVVHAPNTSTSSNGDHGQYAAHGGVLYSNGSTSNSNGVHGLAVWDQGYIHSTGSTVSGNTGGDQNIGSNDDDIENTGALIRR